MADDANCVQALSNSVLFGLCGTSSIFYIDRRESNKPNYVINSNQYRNNGSTNGEFHSLSCNKTNANEFAVGTDYNARIYDVRQMKPCYEIYHNYNCLTPRECYVSWSPSGKYIYIHDRDFNFDSIICFFWDVLNCERVMSNNDMKIEDSGEIFEWKNVDNDTFAWIDDRLLIASYDDAIFSVAPHAKTVKVIDNFRNIDHMGPIVSNLDYNDKTLQLAGANSSRITIWSHYKLPSYPKLGRNNFIDDDSMQ